MNNMKAWHVMVLLLMAGNVYALDVWHPVSELTSGISPLGENYTIQGYLNLSAYKNNSVPFTIYGNNTQVSNLTEWRNYANSALIYISSLGNMFITNNLSVTGTLNATNITGSLLCNQLKGGSDSDFCTDADSGGGTSAWSVSGTNIYNNTANMRVGIGTNIPDAILHVVGNIISTGTIFGQLSAANLTSISNLNYGILVSQANISGISIPAGNVTSLSNSHTHTATNITGSLSIWNFGFLVSQANISGITIPSSNVTGGWDANGITIPFGNTTGAVPQSRMGGITIPATNVTGKDFTLLVSQANITGITIPAANVTSKDFSLRVSQANITGITIPMQNVTGKDYGVLVSQANISGITIPANNVTNGTFGDNNFVFQKNVTVAETLNATNLTGSLLCNQIKGGTDSDFCADADTGGGNPPTSYPATNITNGTLGINFVARGNYTFPHDLTINNNLSVIGNITATNISAKLLCSNIVGGSDADYCADASGGGTGGSNWSATGNYLYNNTENILVGISTNAPYRRLQVNGTFETNETIFSVTGNFSSWFDILGNLNVRGSSISLGTIVKAVYQGSVITQEYLGITANITALNNSLRSMENSNTTQSNQLTAMENSNITQSNQLTAMENSNTTQSNQINSLNNSLAGKTLPANNVTNGTFGLGNFVFQNNLTVSNNVLFVLNSTARVGINTIIPDAALHVIGNIISTGTLFGQLSAGNLTNINLLNYGVLVSQANISGITLPWSNITSALTSLPANNITNGTFQNAPYVFQNNLTVSNNVLFVLNGTARVGINTILPDTALHVVGNIISTGTLFGKLDAINLTNVAALNYGIFISQANITGITIPLANVTSSAYNFTGGDVGITGGNLNLSYGNGSVYVNMSGRLGSNATCTGIYRANGGTMEVCD